ncbi:MAG: cytochrome C [Chryseobacterium sp. SCN 40-13]|nr:MAG: cytochrome C [Chryseobacterium sp. SCN 40-13]
MRHIVIVFFAALFITACSKKETDPNVETNVMMEEPVAQSTEEISTEPGAEGLKMIQGMDCLTCHKIDARLVGPSYQEIADKYTEADMDMLAQKIIDGSVGTWGQIPMTPHAGLSKENAKKMVEYILTLKK